MTDPEDVQSSLAEMDRKLRELQRELAFVARTPEPAAPEPALSGGAPDELTRGPSAPPDYPAGGHGAGAPASGSAGQPGTGPAGQLDAVVDALGERIGELQRLHGELGVALRALRAPAPPDPGEPAFEAELILNAGPFLDIAALSAFEQSLEGIDAAEEVRVRGFEGNRALIDVRLRRPVDLPAEIRRASPFAFRVADQETGRLAIELDPPAAGRAQ